MKQPVFLSFSNEDRPIADRIHDGLERHGLACWMSSRDLPPGADQQASIAAAVGAAELVVLVFSSSANVSQKVIKELSLARGKPMIVARVENISPAGAFRTLVEGAALHNMFGDFADARLEGLCRLVSERLRPVAAAPVPPPVPERAASVRPKLAKPAIAAIVLVAIVAFGVRGWRESTAKPDLWVPQTSAAAASKVSRSPRGAPVETAVAPNVATEVDVPVESVVEIAPAHTSRPVTATKRRAPETHLVVKERSKPRRKSPVESRAELPSGATYVTSEVRDFRNQDDGVATPKPSFNCRYARTHAEHMICANSELAAADVELDRAYRAARRATDDKRRLNEEQADWRALVRDPCPDEDCMLSVYEERIEELREL